MNVAIRHLRSPSQHHRVRRSLLLTNTHSILHHPKLLLLQNPHPTSLASLDYCTSSLASSIPLLRSLFPDDKGGVESVFHLFPRLISEPAKVARNADLLRSLGLSDKTQLASFINESPRLLLLNPNRVSTAFSVVKREFNLDPSSSGDDFKIAVTLAANLKGEVFLNKIGVLRRFGFTDEELLELFRRMWAFMMVEVGYLERWLEFLKRVGGMGPGEILRNEWVVMPIGGTCKVRKYKLIKGLRERGLLVEGEVNMREMFMMDGYKFRKMFVERFEDGEGAELVKAYLTPMKDIEGVPWPSLSPFSYSDSDSE